MFQNNSAMVLGKTPLSFCVLIYLLMVYWWSFSTNLLSKSRSSSHKPSKTHGGQTKLSQPEAEKSNISFWGLTFEKSAATSRIHSLGRLQGLKRTAWKLCWIYFSPMACLECSWLFKPSTKKQGSKFKMNLTYSTRTREWSNFWLGLQWIPWR